MTTPDIAVESVGFEWICNSCGESEGGFETGTAAHMAGLDHWDTYHTF